MSYTGPGYKNLLKSGIFQTKWDPKLGKGIILGKYSRTKTTTKKLTDFDEQLISGPDSEMYRDAKQLALNSGLGQSRI